MYTSYGFNVFPSDFSCQSFMLKCLKCNWSFLINLRSFWAHWRLFLKNKCIYLLFNTIECHFWCIFGGEERYLPKLHLKRPVCSVCIVFEVPFTIKRTDFHIGQKYKYQLDVHNQSKPWNTWQWFLKSIPTKSTHLINWHMKPVHWLLTLTE